MTRPALPLAFLCSVVASARGQELPQAVQVHGEGIEKVDPGVLNLAWEEARVAQLKELVRLPALRRLQLNPSGEDTAAWQAIGVDDLAPLAALQSLEELTLPYCGHLTPQHLRKLAACPRLATVGFLNEAFVLDEGIGRELAAWPALRVLRLDLIEVTAPGFAALAAASALDELELSHCRGLAAQEFAAVTRLPHLRRLALAGPGQPDMLARMLGKPGDPAWALDLTALEKLSAMPRLRELELTSCTLPVPMMLARLPQTLESLTLNSADLNTTMLQGLRRLGGLRRLVLGDAYATDKAALRAAAAAALGSLRLEAFEWQGELDDALRDALRNQPDLQVLRVRCEDDLAFVASLPKLQRLELSMRSEQRGGEFVTVIPAAETMAALAVSKALRAVVYHGRLREDVGDRLQAALGAKIEFRYFH